MSVKLFSRVALVAVALCGCDAAPPVGPPPAPAGLEAPGRPMPDVGAAPVAAAPSEAAAAAPLTVLSARVQPLPPGAPATAAFFTVQNDGAAALRLVRALSPAAISVELHENIEQNGMMMMRPLSGPVEIAPGARLSFAPGGMHVMLIGLRQPLSLGDQVPLSLLFEDGSVARLSAEVAPPPAGP